MGDWVDVRGWCGFEGLISGCADVGLILPNRHCRWVGCDGSQPAVAVLHF